MVRVSNISLFGNLIPGWLKFSELELVDTGQIESITATEGCQMKSNNPLTNRHVNTLGSKDGVDCNYARFSC